MILQTGSSSLTVLAGLTALAYALPALLGRRWPAERARMGLAVAWAMHGLTLLALIWQRPVYFGFAPALSATAWLTMTVYLIEVQIFPQLRVRWALAALGGAAVLLAWWFPGSPMHPQANHWAPVHWVLGLSSYGLFAAAAVHAGLMMRAERQMRQATTQRTGLPLLTLERLTFRFVGAGFVLLTGTLLAGIVFSETLYGASGWRWDHKTVFSVLSWLTIALLLIGRRQFGWRGQRAVRLLYAGVALLLLAYVGSRFVLEVLLGRTP